MVVAAVAAGSAVVAAVAAVVAVAGTAVAAEVAAAVVAAGTEVVEVAVVAGAEPDLEPIATAIGRTWALQIVESLRSADREIEGAWPGTLGEARARIRAELRRPLAIEVIDALARVAYAAAREGWSLQSVPDLEP